MAPIHVLDPTQADGQAKELLDAAQAKLGATPNSMRAMAGSPCSRAISASPRRLHQGASDRRLLSGSRWPSRRATGAPTARLPTATWPSTSSRSLQMRSRAHARTAPATPRLRQRCTSPRRCSGSGAVPAEEFDAARAVGLTDPELAEIVAHVALNVLTNFFNHAFEIDIDYPVVAPTCAPPPDPPQRFRSSPALKPGSTHPRRGQRTSAWTPHPATQRPARARIPRAGAPARHRPELGHHEPTCVGDRACTARTGPAARAAVAAYAVGGCGTYSRIRPRSRKPAAAYTRSAISVD